MLKCTDRRNGNSANARDQPRFPDGCHQPSCKLQVSSAPGQSLQSSMPAAGDGGCPESWQDYTVPYNRYLVRLAAVLYSSQSSKNRKRDNGVCSIAPNIFR